MNREKLVAFIRDSRVKLESDIKERVDAHMDAEHSDATDFWRHAERCSIEVDSWSDRKKNSL